MKTKQNKKELKLEKFKVSKISNEQKNKIKGGDGDNNGGGDGNLTQHTPKTNTTIVILN